MRHAYRWIRSSVRSVTMANIVDVRTQSWPPRRVKKGPASIASTGMSRWPEYCINHLLKFNVRMLDSPG